MSNCKDSSIISIMPRFTTDTIYRVENVDRYDDRDVDYESYR